MISSTIWAIISRFCGLLVLFTIIFTIALFLIKKLRDITNDYIYKPLQERSLKKIFPLMINSLVILSILFAVFTYYESNTIQKENSQIILENLNQEIENNLDMVTSLRKKMPTLKYGEEAPLERFDYEFLEQSIKIIKSRSQRKSIMKIIPYLKRANNIMESIIGIFPVAYQQNQKTPEKYDRIVTHNINILETLINEIETDLTMIQENSK